MAFTLSIGRFGIDIGAAHPQSVRWSGDQVVISGHVKDVASLDEALALRDQLVNQVRRPGTDGIVAVVSALDPTLDGFYILDSASVAAQSNLASYQSTGFLPFTASLTKLNTNMFESSITGALLSNSVGKSGTDGTPFIAPSAGFSTLHSPSAGLAVLTRAIEQHPHALISQSQRIVNITPPEVPVWTVEPLLYYHGAATLKYNGFVVQGLPTFHATDENSVDTALNDGDWELSNGIIRIRGKADSVNIYLAMWGGVSWESEIEIQMIEDTFGTVSTSFWEHLQVVRCDPEETTIRLIGILNGSTGQNSMDLSLRRGAVHVRVIQTSLNALVSAVGFKFVDANAASSFTYGIHRTANDSDGNRWVVGSRTGLTGQSMSSNPWVAGDSGVSGDTLQADYYLAIERDGTGAGGWEDAEAVGDEYLHHISEKVYPIVPGGALL